MRARPKRTIVLWFLGLLSVSTLTCMVSGSPATAQQAPQWNTVFTEALAMRQTAGSDAAFDQVTKKLEQALTLAMKSRDSRAEALTLNQLAEVAESLHRLGKAAEYREKAAAAAARIPDPKMECDALACVGALCQTLGQYPKALHSFEKVVEIRRSLKDERGAATALNDLGNVYKDRGQYPDATKQYERSLQIARNIKDPRVEAAALNSMAGCDMLRGSYETAGKYLVDALTIATKHNDQDTRELVLINLGHLARHAGNYAKASEHFSQALDLVRATKNPQTEGLLLVQLGDLSADWGQYKRASALYKEALDLARQRGDKKTEAATLTRMGAIHKHKREYKAALENLLEARKLNEQIALPTSETDATIGELYLDLADTRNAEIFLKKGRNDALSGLLDLYKGKHDQARTHYERLLKVAEKTKRIDDLFTAYLGLAKVSEAKKQYDKAEQYYAKALELTEELRSSLLPTERKSFLSVKVNGFDRSEPAKGLTRLKFKQNRAAESVTPSEMAKARSFADKLVLGTGRGYSGVPPDVLEKETELVVELATLKKIRDCCSRESDRQRWDNLTRQIEHKQKEVNDFVDMLWRDYTQYAAVKHPRPITPDAWALKEDEYALILDVLDEGVGIALFKGKHLEASAYVPWKAAELTQAIEKLREPFEQVDLGSFDPALAKNLYDRLIEPVIGKVPRGTPLIVIPDGVLAELPFEALVAGGQVEWKDSPQGEYPVGLTYLADMHPISYYQSMNTLTLQRALRKKPAAPGQVLVLADPVFKMNDPRAKDAQLTVASAGQGDLVVQVMNAIDGETTGNLDFARLPETRKLAEELQKVYGARCAVYQGLDASKTVLFDAVSADLGRYAYAVFATHGVYSTTIPWIMEPVLAMTMVPPGMDGFLRMTEVMSLDLKADAVVLAACQTALGEHVSGEGVLSMGRAFQYAGARSVVMTLWNADEKTAMELLTRFFTHLNNGKTKLEALSLAKAELRSHGSAHPFYWASFVIAGETD